VDNQEATIHAFLADRANAILHPDLWKEAKKWSSWNDNKRGPAPCDKGMLARAVSSFLTTTPYIYKDPDELDLDHLIG